MHREGAGGTFTAVLLTFLTRLQVVCELDYLYLLAVRLTLLNIKAIVAQFAGYSSTACSKA
jgi:hypothetical protein